MAINWRAWVHAKLTTTAGITALVPGTSIFAAGSVEGRPEVKPFIFVRMMPKRPQVKSGIAHEQLVEVWAHDRPGSYKQIEDILAAVRTALEGQVVSVDAIACRWLGESQDLSDDGFDTITRYATYQLVGRG